MVMFIFSTFIFHTLLDTANISLTLNVSVYHLDTNTYGDKHKYNLIRKFYGFS